MTSRQKATPAALIWRPNAWLRLHESVTKSIESTPTRTNTFLATSSSVSELHRARCRLKIYHSPSRHAKSALRHGASIPAKLDSSPLPEFSALILVRSTRYTTAFLPAEGRKSGECTPILSLGPPLRNHKLSDPLEPGGLLPKLPSVPFGDALSCGVRSPSRDPPGSLRELGSIRAANLLLRPA